MLDKHRSKFLAAEVILAKIFAVLPLTPNQYTGLSLLSAVAYLAAMFYGNYFWALAFFLLAALLDLVDGAVARTKNLSTKKGAYLDTIADRYVEAIVLLGLAFAALPIIFLPAYVWIFLAMFGSAMTTYAKAAAKEKELSVAELKGGLMSRGERMIVIAIVIAMVWLGQAAAASALLMLLAILSNLTAWQRIFAALQGK
jgi:archaetidylinositol phosphate synthase